MAECDHFRGQALQAWWAWLASTFWHSIAFMWHVTLKLLSDSRFSSFTTAVSVVLSNTLPPPSSGEKLTIFTRFAQVPLVEAGGGSGPPDPPAWRHPCLTVTLISYYDNRTCVQNKCIAPSHRFCVFLNAPGQWQCQDVFPIREWLKLCATFPVSDAAYITWPALGIWPGLFPFAVHSTVPTSNRLLTC